MKPLVLFDMDGTILNSVPTIAESCNAALAENGLPQHPLPAYNGMVGNGMRVLIRRACPADAPAELQEKVIASYDRIYTEACRRPGIIYPGIAALLQKLDALMRDYEPDFRMYLLHLEVRGDYAFLFCGIIMRKGTPKMHR